MKQFNILNYPAPSPTQSIQNAIDHCFLQGGGEVMIPAGRYPVKGLRLRSNVTLHLMEEAILLGSTDPEDYFGYLGDTIEPISTEERDSVAPTVNPGHPVGRSVMPYSRWNNAIIRAIHAENIAIIGEKGSLINGQNCFDEQGEEGFRGPHGINLWYCQGVRLEGYTLKDSGNWAHAIQNSQDIQMRQVTVLGGHDGFDIRSCDRILVEDCIFRTGDDCIAGFDNIGVTVRRCLFDSACSMLRFGGTDVLVEHCEGFAPSTYGHRLSLSMEEKRNRTQDTSRCRHNCLTVFLYYCDHRANLRKTPGNITLRHCAFHNPDQIMGLPFGEIWCCNRSLSDITFENCTFDGIKSPSKLLCPPEEPLTLRFQNGSATARTGAEGIPFLQGESFSVEGLESLTLSGFAPVE